MRHSWIKCRVSRISKSCSGKCFLDRRLFSWCAIWDCKLCCSLLIPRWVLQEPRHVSVSCHWNRVCGCCILFWNCFVLPMQVLVIPDVVVTVDFSRKRQFWIAPSNCMKEDWSFVPPNIQRHLGCEVCDVPKFENVTLAMLVNLLSGQPCQNLRSPSTSQWLKRGPFFTSQSYSRPLVPQVDRYPGVQHS